jgi:CHAD domain-containing protein
LEAVAFRVKGNDPLAKELRRLLRKQFDKTSRLLAPRRRVGADAIHEARTGLKKIRATLRLLHHALGGMYRAENQRLREAAHALSRVRDADVSVETLTGVEQRHPTVVTPAVASPVRRALGRRARHERARVAAVLAKARAALERSEKSVLGQVGSAGRWPMVRSGLLRGYRQARRAMASVSVDAGAADVHRWRRRVKDHWYHVRMFESTHRPLRIRVRRLKQLETWLGHDHNLALLKTTILESPDRFGDATITAVVIGCLVKDQMTYRRRALALGRRLFVGGAGEFRKSLETWWPGPRRTTRKKRR